LELVFLSRNTHTIPGLMPKIKSSKLIFPKFYFVLILISCSFFEISYGQNHEIRYNSIDVLDYKFEIALNDSTDQIEGNATIQIFFKIALEKFTLDLKNINDKGQGMIIEEVSEDRNSVRFIHQNDQIEISCKSTNIGEIKIFHIKYHGIPDDGLIITTNKFGDRVFFADCWPNRAHHWLPTVDHPSDKATVEFIVKAPSHYQVVANGTNIEETNIGDEIISHWKTEVPLPTKVMVIGVAQFAKQNLPDFEGIPISTWVYPQNREEGFSDYDATNGPLAFYTTHIAAYPFSKMASVQSKTVFGGMENASCIFYAERTVTGKRKPESLFAHEIAHQWFGDAVSELNWHHIWLSEGFATYFTSLYLEYQQGRDEFVNSMKNQRKRIIDYSKKNLAPVIDTSQIVSIDLLNTNSYQKGGWFLHMLRNELGDELFWKCIRTYYKKFEYRNALTEDFQEVVESISGKDFDYFFKQWLYKSGQPQLKSTWDYDGKMIKFKLTQLQKQYIFRFPLELKIINADKTSSTETISVNNAKETFLIISDKRPKNIILDPNTKLLFETIDIDN